MFSMSPVSKTTNINRESQTSSVIMKLKLFFLLFLLPPSESFPTELKQKQSGVEGLRHNKEACRWCKVSKTQRQQRNFRAEFLSDGLIKWAAPHLSQAFMKERRHTWLAVNYQFERFWTFRKNKRTPSTEWISRNSWQIYIFLSVIS